MQFTATLLFAAAGLITTVSAHGFVTSPQARLAGTAMGAACGAQVLSNQESDNYGNIQGELQVAATQTDYDEAACDIWLCKGYKFADNTANVQSYTAGQVVPITVDIRAPHTGYANVSIVATATNTMISAELASWDVYASNSETIPANQTQFSITIPSDLGSKCATAGDCVIQWYWNAASIDQTYESCIDFTIGGDGSSPVVSSASSTSAAASTAVIATSSTALVPTSTIAPVVSSSAAIIPSSAVVSLPSTVATSSSSAISIITPPSSPAPVPTSFTPSSVIIAPTTLVTLTSSSKSTSSTPAAPTSSASGTVPLYYQCGGANWTGATVCETGSTCKVQNQYYSQCVAV